MATLRTEKTGEEIYAPISADFEAAVKAGGAGDLLYVISMHGREFTRESFGNAFHDASNAAGVRKSAHGPRKRAATLLAERGGTEMELQTVFGWRTNKQSEVYTRSANRKLMAKERKETKSSEPISELQSDSDKTGKKARKNNG